MGRPNLWELTKALRSLEVKSLRVQLRGSGGSPTLETLEALGLRGRISLPQELRKALENYLVPDQGRLPWWLEGWNPGEYAPPGGETEVHLDLEREEVRIRSHAYTEETEETLAFIPRHRLRKALGWEYGLPQNLAACRGEGGWTASPGPAPNPWFLEKVEEWLRRETLPVDPREEGGVETYTCILLDGSGLEVVARKPCFQLLPRGGETLPLAFLCQEEMMEELAWGEE